MGKHVKQRGIKSDIKDKEIYSEIWDIGCNLRRLSTSKWKGLEVTCNIKKIMMRQLI